jgi:rhomboid protease GluP
MTFMLDETRLNVALFEREPQPGDGELKKQACAWQWQKKSRCSARPIHLWQHNASFFVVCRYKIPVNPESDNTEVPLRLIRARSKRQVMDWALVLASQEIETAIIEDEAGWALAVGNSDFERAGDVIRQYRIENRKWHWHQWIPGTGLSFHWGSLVWCGLLLFFHVWSTTQSPAMTFFGLMNNQAVGQGEWWRLFTAVFLHGDWAHLAANLTTGFVLFGLTMARYGPGVALLTALFAGAGGNLAGYWLYTETHRGLGASGMVMGALGLLAVQSLVAWWKHPRPGFIITRALGAGILMLALMGFSPGTDILAHVGGFISGCVLGIGLNLLPVRWEKAGVNRWASLLLTALVVLVWHLAMRNA